MLGNVKPYMPMLSDEAKKRYNAVYCGLCKTLGKQNGIGTRFILDYDMAFVTMLYDSLNNENFSVNQSVCFANPFKKKDIQNVSDGNLFAADVLVLLAYFKLIDNIHDEKILNRTACILLYPYLYLKYRNAYRRRPHLAALLKEQSDSQFKAEKEFTDTDNLARPTAIMVKSILQECAPEDRKFIAGNMGFFLGRMIYLLDALTDRKEDEKEGKFNIFNINGTSQEDAKAECFMALGELAYWYSQLDMKENKEITDNIIYISLARNIKFAGEEKETTDGQQLQNTGA